jgi:hypothetical protein
MTGPGQLTNAAREVEIGGKVYKVRELDVDRQFQLAQWFFDRRLAAVERMEAGEDVKERWRTSLMRDFDSYQPGGVAYSQAAVTPAGAAKGLYLALADDNPGVEEETVRKWFVDRIEAAARAAVEAQGDPKASSPGSSQPGARRCPTCGGKLKGRSPRSAASRRHK